MQENGKALKRKHNLIMEDRKTLTLTGISDVDSFDEQTVVLIRYWRVDYKRQFFAD